MSEPVLVVGSVALDSVRTPAGEVRETLGGAAVYFSLAARLFAPVRLVGVVGEDFPADFRRLLEGKEIDLRGLETARGRTFRWSGAYGRDLNVAKTLDTQLNVFESFRPRLTPEQKRSPVVFLANIDPELQWEVLAQMEAPALVACDTMNYWISSKRPALKELLGRVHVLLINDEEARSLAREHNLCRASRRLCEWGPSVVVVKKGEHGVLLTAGGRHYALPAYPVEDVKDPTGAGDSFAGGFLGYLASVGGALDAAAVKRAALYGAVLGSFNVQEFGTGRLESLEPEAVRERYQELVGLLSVEDGAPVPA